MSDNPFCIVASQAEEGALIVYSRDQVVQQIIDKKCTRNYLEIGVFKGKCFLKIKAPFKMAVDPKFKISAKHKWKYLIKNPSNRNNRYFEMTSDAFFVDFKDLLKDRTPEVAFIDGLHTYQQSLKDVLNIISFMPLGSVVVMHDCNPQTEAAGWPAKSYDHAKSLDLKGWTTKWNGDVWKAIVHIRSLHPELDAFVLDCDHGLGVVVKRKGDSELNFTQEQVEQLTYSEFESERDSFLNLKPPVYLQEFLKTID